MSGFRIPPEVEAELDDIWLYIAKASSSIDIANRLIDQITDRLWLLSQHPQIGRRRDDLRPGLRSSAVGEYVIVYKVEDEGIVILHVFRGSRDIPSLLGD